MNEAQREAAVRKIKACLARADEERNANEHERATALRQANALMEKYSIEIIDLGDTEDLGPIDEENHSVGAKPWKAHIYNNLAPLYGVKVLYGRGLVTLVGRQHYRNVVSDMAQYVMSSIEREAKAMSGDKTYKADFRKGAATGIDITVKRILAERAKAHDGISQSKALVLVDHFKNELEATTTWMNAHFGKLKKGSRMGIKNYAAYADGKAYGESINLSDQLGTSTPKGRLT
jgi:hypothetical protein